MLACRAPLTRIQEQRGHHRRRERMRQAIDGGRRRRAGSVSPRPWVGAVVVPADGPTIPASPVPPRGAPGPHAEIVALPAAGAAARGRPLYTTLEPCSHHGRTRPCADAVIDAGVARVVVGLDRSRPQGGRRTASPGCGPRASRSRSGVGRGRRRATSSRPTSCTAAPVGPTWC